MTRWFGKFVPLKRNRLHRPFEQPVAPNPQCLEGVAELKGLNSLAGWLQEASQSATELLEIEGCWVWQGVGVEWEQGKDWLAAIGASSVMSSPIEVANPMSVAIVGWGVAGEIQLLLETVEMTFEESELPQRGIPFEAGEQAEQAEVLSLVVPQQQVVGAGIELPLSSPLQSKANFWLRCCLAQIAMPAQTT